MAYTYTPIADYIIDQLLGYQQVNLIKNNIRYMVDDILPVLQAQLGKITNAAPYTPSGSFTTNSTYTGSKYRTMDRGFYRANLAFSALPTMTGTKFTLNQPASETIDTTKLVGDITKDLMIPGTVTFRDASAGSGVAYPLLIKFESTTTISFYLQSVSTFVLADSSAAGRFTNNQPVAIAVNDTLTIEYNVPIVEFA